MNTPSPAIVTQDAVRRLPRLALILFVLTYVLPGFWGREPWKTIDMGSLGVMLDLATGASPWQAPTFLGLPPDAQALLPYWLGAWVMAIAPAGWDAATLSRLPFILMLGLTMGATWKAIELLARSPAAQPVAFAFGGEARPDDYARVMADAGLLALMSCLGLAQASHEVTPMAAQLCMSSLLFCGVAGLHTHRGATHLALTLLALLSLSLSGAPTLALLMGVGALAWLILDKQHPNSTVHALILALGLALLLVLSQHLQLWQFTWRSLPPTAKQTATLLRLWVWFTWPAWPLVLWTLWAWRQAWWGRRPSRHIALPLLLMLAPALAAIVTVQEERVLLLTLPYFAALAAFALPTLRRSVSAFIDWFTLLFFSGSALLIWIIWCAGVSGWPTQPAANLRRLLPGLDLVFSWPIFALALAATGTWVALVAWRVGRHRSALWKSLVLPASGATLCWLLLMTLWLPMLDFARSYAPLVRNVVALMSQPECIQVHGLSKAQMAALRHHGQMRIDLSGDSRCEWLVVGMRAKEAFESTDQAPSWRWVQTVRRPTDQYENLVLYRRLTEPQP
ncbi:MAG: hypothetical protein QM527_04740 [Alphaproteobacteria bacterium]|nr:hypothetical protein [Alphaproteobacteria bacterium]